MDKSPDTSNFTIPSPSQSPYMYLLLAPLLLLILTRLTSGTKAQPIASENGTTTLHTVPTPPYWFPILGHLPSYILSPSSLFRRTTQGIFAIKLGPTRWNIIWQPHHVAQLFHTRPDIVAHGDLFDRLLKTVFGFPAREKGKYKAAEEELLECYKHLQSEDLVRQTAERLRRHIPDLVTGNESEVDLMGWEKEASGDVRVNNDSEPSTASAKLLPLIKAFIAHTAIPSFMGSDFLPNNPEFPSQLWALDAGFMLLVTGLPRWVPIPGLPRAHIARRNCLEMLMQFHDAMELHFSGQDPGPKWTGLDDVGDLVKARMRIYRAHGFSIRARASIELSLMAASSANSNPLVFWLVQRLASDRALLELVREEIAPFVEAMQPVSPFPLPEPPRLDKFDVEGLCTQCPLLKSCYIESLRLDARIWNVRVLKQDMVLRADGKGEGGWLLKKGEFVQATQDLHNLDPAYFEYPEVWKADRHVLKEKGAAEMGTIRRYGGGTRMCKGRAFAYKEIMMSTAAIISMWDFEPATGDSWKLPRHEIAAGTYTTADDTRVLVKRRPLVKKVYDEQMMIEA